MKIMKISTPWNNLLYDTWLPCHIYDVTVTVSVHHKRARNAVSRASFYRNIVSARGGTINRLS